MDFIDITITKEDIEKHNPTNWLTICIGDVAILVGDKLVIKKETNE